MANWLVNTLAGSNYAPNKNYVVVNADTHNQKYKRGVIANAGAAAAGTIAEHIGNRIVEAITPKDPLITYIDPTHPNSIWPVGKPQGHTIVDVDGNGNFKIEKTEDPSNPPSSKRYRVEEPPDDGGEKPVPGGETQYVHAVHNSNAASRCGGSSDKHYSLYTSSAYFFFTAVADWGSLPTGNIVCLNDMPISATVDGRIGNCASLKSVHVRGYLSYGGTIMLTAGPLHRTMIVYDRASNGLRIDVRDLLYFVGAANAAMYMPYNVDNSSRFEILYDNTYAVKGIKTQVYDYAGVLSTANSSIEPTLVTDILLDLGKRSVRYNSTSGSIPVSGGLFLLTFGHSETTYALQQHDFHLNFTSHLVFE